MLPRPKKIFEELRGRKMALAAFSAFNFESVLGVVRAANNRQAPVGIQFTPEVLKIGGIETWANLVINLAKESNQPLVLHLEGGDNEMIKECIQAGFTSVKVRWTESEGGGKLARVEEIVSYAHRRGVWVEGELSTLPSSQAKIGESALTDKAAAKRFVKEAGIDALAVSVGAIYGAFTGREYINFDLLNEIERELGGVTLTTGGGSGVDNSQIERLSQTNVTKITFGTVIAEAWIKAVREMASQLREGREASKVVATAAKAVRLEAEKKISLTCSGKLL